MNTLKRTLMSRQTFAFGTLAGIFALALTMIGCNHTLDPGRLDLEPDEQLVVGQLDGVQVALINNQPNTEKFNVGTAGIHRYEGSLSGLTDALVSHLGYELRKRNAVITEKASKVLKLRVEPVDFDTGAWTLGTKGRVHVETGSGYVRNIEIETHTFGTVNRLYAGMVQIAVTEILKDPKIASYLK